MLLFQVTFAPTSAGSYEAVVAVYAHLVVSAPQDFTKPIANVVLKGIAEDPRLAVQTSSRAGEEEDSATRDGGVSSPSLDYGMLVGGSSASLQLKMANRGSVCLPLCLSINAKVSHGVIFLSHSPITLIKASCSFQK